MSMGRDRFRYEYGAGPLHLLAVAASLLLAGYGLLRITELPSPGRILIWIVAAALLHDLVALPLYSLLNRIAHGAADRVIESRAAAVLALNHVRVPAGLSLLLLVVYLPLILRFAPDEYAATTGRSVDPYLGRWLLISGALFLVSGILYALRLRRGAAEPALPPAAEKAEEAMAGDDSLGWRIWTWVWVAAAGLAILWVAAALVVGLTSSGL
jgi:hypothetical protein